MTNNCPTCSAAHERHRERDAAANAKRTRTTRRRDDDDPVPRRPKTIVKATIGKPSWSGRTLVGRLEGGMGSDEYETIEFVGPKSRGYVWVGSDKRFLGTISLRRLKSLICAFERGGPK